MEKEIYVSPLNLQKIELDGFTNLFVHSEHNNETGTHKDRKAEEFRKKFEPIQYNLKDWVFSIISSGSMAQAMQNMLKKNGGNDLRVLIDENTDESVIEKLLRVGCDVYTDDLSRKNFSSADILEATENTSDRGKKLTSIYETQFSDSYFDLAEEIFKKNPRHIIVPFGTGELFSSINLIAVSDVKPVAMYLMKMKRNSLFAKPANKVSIYGATTNNPKTSMSKLYSESLPFLPKLMEKENNMYSIDVLKEFSGNVESSEIINVSEDNLAKAKEIYDGMNIPVEPSALSSMVLFLENKHLFNKDEKIIIVSTGKQK